MAEKIVNYNDIAKVQDMVTLNLLKESFDADYEKQKKSVETNEMAKSMITKKFGYLKECFENISPELFKSKEGRVIINKYIATIKESAELKKMHLLYECVRKANKDIDVDKYLTEALNIIGPVNKRNLNLSTQKLGEVLGEACQKLGKERVEKFEDKYGDREKVDEAIEYVGTTKKTPKNLLEYIESCDTIKEHINLHETYKRLGGHCSVDIDKAVNEFNNKYGKELTENEQALVKELIEGKDKESVFNKYKENCLNKLTEKKGVFESKGDAMSSERMGIILEKVNKKKYNPETVNTDVFNLFEMTNSME